MPKTRTFLSPREALEKLKVKPGGEGNAVEVCNGLMIGLGESRSFGWEDRRDGVYEPYEISTLFRGRRMTIALPRTALVTKGKSPWSRSNLYRLTQETIDRFEPQIAMLVARCPK
jgi:hypothetical protein